MRNAVVERNVDMSDGVGVAVSSVWKDFLDKSGGLNVALEDDSSMPGLNRYEDSPSWPNATEVGLSGWADESPSYLKASPLCSSASWESPKGSVEMVSSPASTGIVGSEVILESGNLTLAAPKLELVGENAPDVMAGSRRTTLSLPTMADLTVVTGDERYFVMSEELNLFPHNKESEGMLQDICKELQLSASPPPSQTPLNPAPTTPPPPASTSSTTTYTLPNGTVEITSFSSTTNGGNCILSAASVADAVAVGVEDTAPPARNTRSRRGSVRSNRHSIGNISTAFGDDSNDVSSPVQFNVGSDGQLVFQMTEDLDYFDAATTTVGGTSRRHRNISETSDGSDSYKRKKRRYEEEPSADPALEKSRKNAIIAKRNREKKKQLLEELESRVDRLQSDNEHLESDNGQLRERVASLEEEVYYMKSILANQSALADVLGSLKTSDLRLSTSFEASRPPGNRQPRSLPAKVSGGICLHVDGKSVSMEMCHKCSQMAKGAARTNESRTPKHKI